jgi:hypothetical protein
VGWIRRQNIRFSPGKTEYTVHVKAGQKNVVVNVVLASGKKQSIKSTVR